MNRKLSACLKLAVIPLIGALAACGGSSGSSSTTSDSATLSGTVVAAPVNGASVLVKDAAGNTIAGPVITAADGSYSVQISNAHLASALVLESSGGTFDDEATGLNREAGTLAVQIAAGALSGNAAVHMTPATTIVRHMMTANNSLTLDEAQTAFQTAFGFSADFSEKPVDATNPPAGATEAQLLAGLHAATFSQLAMDMGLSVTDQFDLLTALAEDLADGTLDGEGVGGTVTVGEVTLPANIQNQFTLALQNFHGGSRDNTGLTSTQIGTLPFAKDALSSSYRFEYIDGMMAAMEGKTQFKIRVTDAATGLTAQTGLALSLAAKMHMATMTHMTPVDGCSESATPGTYDCTLYYLMASEMAGVSMGYWELLVTANSETVAFFPPVGMGMNGNGKHQLRGQSSDLIPNMMTVTEQRPYYLFKDAITGTTGDHTVRLFVAVKESMMVYPKLFLNNIFNSGTDYELTANPVVVELSTDDGLNWLAMTDEGDGYWSVANVAGLTDGVENSFLVRVTVNSEQKTTDGLAPALDGTNDYAVFTTTL